MSSIDILSAASYPFPEVLDQRSPRRADPDVLYGGLTLIQDEQTMNSTSARRQKREAKNNNKSNNNSNDDGTLKRKRGRPRVLDKDENAAERRRTQIRMAQRAYRSRKEATITVLSERLAEMDIAIQEMNKSVGSFRDELIGSGLLFQHPKIRQSLQTLAEKSDALVALSSGSAGTFSKSPSDAGPESVETTSAPSLPDVVVAATAGGDGLLPAAMGDSPDQYNSLYSSASNSSPFGGDPLLQAAPYQDDGMEMITPLPSSYFENQQKLQPSLPYQLPLPSSYSFQESNFVRRLRRRCVEYGFRLLSDANRDPRELSRMFSFSLGFRNCQTMIARFSAALGRPNLGTTTGTGSNNNGSTWPQAIPSNYHVGNAGTHFLQNRDNSNSSTSTSTSTAGMYPVRKFIGPWSFHFADLPHKNKSVGELLDSVGMDGEWFDSNDVDGYLKEMGINIDAHSNFVTVPSVSVNNAHLSASSGSSPAVSPFRPQSSSSSSIQMHIDPFLDSSTSASSSAPTSVPASAPANETETAAMLQFASYGDADMSIGMDLDLLAPLMSSEKTSQPSMPDYSQIPAQTLESLFTSANNPPTTTTPATQKQNPPRVLDVEHFLDRLMQKAVCLGEKSGYRKQDVDDCLRVACYPMF